MKIKNAHIKNLHARSISPGIVNSGLQLYLDAGNTASYPGSGTTWTDTVGNKNFTLVNGPSYNSDKGGYIVFNPNNSQYAQCSSSLATMTSWTIEAWHYYEFGTAGPYPALVTEIYTGGSLNYALGKDAGTGGDGLAIGYYDGANGSGSGWHQTTAIPLTLNNWYHIVGTFNGTTLRLYINGQLVQSIDAAHSINSSNAGIRLMARWDQIDCWGGGLAVVRMYNQDIGEYGVTKNYLAERRRFFAPTGLTSSDPSTSAWQIKQDYPNSPDGLYWIQNANINSGNPVQVYCDMTTLGGGWTLLVQNNHVDGWTLENTLSRNATTPPGSLVNYNSSQTPDNNYSIVGWADYIKRSDSGFDYMIEAGFRGRNGGAYTANEAYSFTETWAGQGVGNASNDGSGWRKNITEIEKFPAGAPGDNATWSYHVSAVEARMPWYGVDQQGYLTTDGPGNAGWWGTLISYAYFNPAPWFGDGVTGTVNMDLVNPRVIWYWVR